MVRFSYKLFFNNDQKMKEIMITLRSCWSLSFRAAQDDLDQLSIQRVQSSARTTLLPSASNKVPVVIYQAVQIKWLHLSSDVSMFGWKGPHGPATDGNHIKQTFQTVLMVFSRNETPFS